MRPDASSFVMHPAMAGGGASGGLYDDIAEAVAALRAHEIPIQHPGRLFNALAYKPGDFSLDDLCAALHLHRKAALEVLDGHRNIGEQQAEGMAKLAGNTSSFWMRAQAIYDFAQGEELSMHPRTSAVSAEDLTGTVHLAGTVRSFNPTKGYGFISPSDGGPDVFVHVKAVRSGDPKEMKPGKPVLMRVGRGPKGPEAFDVRAGSGTKKLD